MKYIMADAFCDREKGFEAKYKLDEENRFKVDARRNKLLGEWLAFQFGFTSDAVAECAVVGTKDPDRGMIVKAFIVLNEGFNSSDELAKDIQVFVKETIAPYKYPRAIEFIKSLPKSATGKLLRKDLKN